MKTLGELLYVIFCICTSIVGIQIHHNAFYAIINFILVPISWLYCVICHDVNMTVIREAFSFFLQ